MVCTMSHASMGSSSRTCTQDETTAGVSCRRWCRKGKNRGPMALTMGDEHRSAEGVGLDER
jgi:hypothetical protein